MYCTECGDPLRKRTNESIPKYMRRKFCSNGCRNSAVGRAKRITKTCVICGTEFTVPPATEHRYVTCSPECKYAYLLSRHAMLLEKSRGPEARLKFSASRSARNLRMVCGCGCGTPIAVRPSKMAKMAGERVFLNREHYENWFQGENVYLWRGGALPYYGPNWKAQRRKVRERDKACQWCDKTPEENGKALEVHHIVPFRNCADYEEANQLSNLIAICKACHIAHHARDRARRQAAHGGDHQGP